TALRIASHLFPVPAPAGRSAAGGANAGHADRGALAARAPAAPAWLRGDRDCVCRRRDRDDSAVVDLQRTDGDAAVRSRAHCLCDLLGGLAARGAPYTKK